MRMGRAEKAAFLTAFLGGMLAHLYSYTNLIPNFDGISRVYDQQQMTISGRWFLHYVSYLHGFVQMPMVTGTLAMLFLALTAALTIGLFEIRNVISGGLWGLLSVTIPAVAYTNTFSFTVDAYCLAIFLAAASVWAVGRGRLGFPAGVVLLALSMGTYQAYAAVAIALCVLLVWRETLKPDSEVRDIVRRGVRYVLYLAAGALLYAVILYVFLWVKDLELLSYRGMDQLSEGYPIGELPALIGKTYTDIIAFAFEQNTTEWPAAGWSIAGFVGMAAVFALLYIRQLRQLTGTKGLRVILGAAMLVVLPVAVDFGRIMSPWTDVSQTMRYAYVFLCLPVLWLAQPMDGAEEGSRFWRILPRAAAGCALLLTVSWWETDNLLYTMLDQAHRATETFMTNLAGRIESTEGYQAGMEVVIVGGFPSNRYGSDITVYDAVSDGSVFPSSVVPLNKHIYYYLQDWLNIPIEEPDEEVFLEVSASDEFEAMPLYPDDGSVCLIGDRIVVKLQESYTPRAQYEKDYEQRR